MLNEDAEPGDLQIATSLVRIVQEALTNVSRHAQASEVCISLCRTETGILLEVSDDGRGIREEVLTAPDSYGVLGMQERARLCGGELQITGAPGGGTCLRLTVPYNQKEGT
jgi:signal transduction histidine kinase